MDKQLTETLILFSGSSIWHPACRQAARVEEKAKVREPSWILFYILLEVFVGAHGSIQKSHSHQPRAQKNILFDATLAKLSIFLPRKQQGNALGISRLHSPGTAITLTHVCQTGGCFFFLSRAIKGGPPHYCVEAKLGLERGRSNCLCLQHSGPTTLFQSQPYEGSG